MKYLANRKSSRLFNLLALLVYGYLVFSVTRLAAEEKSNLNLGATYGGTLVVGITGDVDSFNPLFGETSISQEITHLLLLGLADLN